MRDDLLDAQAAIDWAVSDLPILQEKIERWRNDSPYRLVGDRDTQPGKKLIHLADVKLPPAIISAEAGIILHAIRSSLDMLCVALAERNGAIDPTDTYFPVWRDKAAFDDPTDRTAKKIKRLSQIDQAAIKNLKPYKGGNDYLAALHELDVTRKHRRLVSVFIAPGAWTLSGDTTGRDFQIGQWNGFHDNAIVAAGPAHATEGDLTLELQIRFAEPVVVAFKQLVEILRDFTRLAAAIIRSFDGPDP